MVSSLTTTGATLFDPARLPASVHLWRALVGWMGGFFMLVTAIAILAPLNLGGFEVLSPARRRPQGRDADRARSSPQPTPPSGCVRYTLGLLPIYAGLTLVLWIGLLIAGDAPLVALCHAMSTLATSGISPVGGLSGPASGIAGRGR